MSAPETPDDKLTKAPNQVTRMTSEPQDNATRLIMRWLLRLGVLAVLVVLAVFLFKWINASGAALDKNARFALVIAILLGYALLIAIPFVPAIELAATIVVMRGPEAVPYIYASTLAGLMLAYMIGRFIPDRSLQKIAGDLRLRKLEALLYNIASKTRDERLDLMRDRLPKRIAWLATDYRYLMIAVLINLPGSSLIGGGGGIMMLAAITRVFGAWAIFLTLALAIAPLPVIIYFFDIDILSRFR